MFALHVSPILTLLIQIASILLLSRVMGWLMRLIGQPQVIGEMAAGIMLGPSLLGLIGGGKWMMFLFPKESLGNLGLLSQLGVMLFMFLVGLELDPKLLKGQGKAALVTGTVGVFVPLVTGAALGLALLYGAAEITGATPSKLVFCLFMGTSMSITAFPVLARILTERNLQRTKSGALALTCAAMDDVMGWCLLAFVLAVAHVKGLGSDSSAMAGSGENPAVVVAKTVGLAGLFVAVMVFGVRRFLTGLRRHYESRGYISQDVLAIVFLLLIACSVTTDIIGIHQIFGAFLLGAVMPKDGAFIKHLSEKVEDFAVLFLLPLFFAYTGLRTELGSLGGGEAWLICGVVILTAVLGKFGGVTLAARWYGMNWREGSLLGVLMNTRGLMELIVLNIGLNYGVLSKPMFAMMVLMALVTTFMTSPLMHLLYSPARQRRELEEAGVGKEEEKSAGVHVVVPVSLKSSVTALVRMGAMLMGGETGRLYAMHFDRPEELELRARSVLAETDGVLESAQGAARAANVPISAISLVSRSVSRDIVEAATRYRANWVVLGWHKPVFMKNILGGTVGRVLEQAPANIAVLIDKGWGGHGELKRILVPYIGEAQDRGALMAAEHLGRLPGTEVTVLHVVKPNRGAGDARLGVQDEVQREFPGANGQGSVRIKIVESDAPGDVAIEESYRFDLMVLGLNPSWNLDNHEITGKHDNVAQLSNCSLLIVHANPAAGVGQKAPAREAAGTH
ncbi:MAG: cation:proton antiporter domain-containing protein [Phycisphaerae bacterium]